MNKISRAAVGAALLAVAGFASATTVSVDVDALANSVYGAGGNGADGKDTGLDISAGQFITITVPSIDLWQNDPDSSYISGADGHDGFVGDGHPNFDFTADGITAPYGALVGRIGTDYFLVGENYSGTATASGELELFYWDSDYANNSGTVTATVTAVPEPGNMALMALALGAFALTRRRKA